MIPCMFCSFNDARRCSIAKKNKYVLRSYQAVTIQGKRYIVTWTLAEKLRGKEEVRGVG